MSPEPWPCLPSPRGRDAGDPIPGRVWTRVLGSRYFPRRGFLEEVGVLLPAHLRTPLRLPHRLAPQTWAGSRCLLCCLSVSVSLFLVLSLCPPLRSWWDVFPQRWGQTRTTRAKGRWEPRGTFCSPRPPGNKAGPRASVSPGAPSPPGQPREPSMGAGRAHRAFSRRGRCGALPGPRALPREPTDPRATGPGARADLLPTTHGPRPSWRHFLETDFLLKLWMLLFKREKLHIHCDQRQCPFCLKEEITRRANVVEAGLALRPRGPPP